MADKQYLDDNGNPIAAPTQKQYLDPNTGEPIKTQARTPPTEGFWHSLGAQFGMTPEAAKAAVQDQKDHPIKSFLLNLVDPAGVARGLVGQAKQSGGELGQAYQAAKHGNNPDAAVHAITAVPVVGPALAKGADQYAQGDYAGEAGTLLGASAQAAPAVLGAVDSAAPGRPVIPNPPGATAIASTAKSAAARFVPSLVDGPPESLLTRAVKPGKNNVNWNADAQKAIPLMKSAEEQLGRPVAGVDDALEAAAIAKKGIWRQYQARLGAGGQIAATIDGNAIADQMVNSIDKRTALQNPELVDKVKAIADTYRRQIPLNEAEDFLQSANKDLNTYYTKNKVGRQVAENDPEISSTVAEAESLRKALYSKLDQVSGPGAAQLKQAYGALTNVEKELYGRQLVAARQAPESLSEQLSTVRGAGKIAKGVFTASPGDVLEGAQNIAVSRALKARNSSDAMIERAFQAAQPAQPFLAPSNPRFAGLLERGAIQTPAPAQGASPTSPPAIAIDATTRAQRLGLLLPEKTGGPIELPYVPEMSGGEKLAALMQLLRKSRQPLALPAQSTPIQLPPPR